MTGHNPSEGDIVERLRELLEKATPGPWGLCYSECEVEIYAERTNDIGNVYPALDEFYIYIDGEQMGRHPLSEADAQLIALAPQMARELLRISPAMEGVKVRPVTCAVCGGDFQPNDTKTYIGTTDGKVYHYGCWIANGTLPPSPKEKTK